MLDEYLNVKTALLGAVVFLFVYCVIQCMQFRMKYRLPPGPFAWPLLGNVLHLATGNSLETFDKLTKKYGPVFSFWIGPIHSITLNTVEAIDEALVKHGADFAGRPHLASMDRFTKGGKDIAMADYGPVWKVQRKIAHVAMRTFTEGDKLTHFLLEDFNTMAKDWRAETAEFDPKESLQLFTTNMLSSLVFGERFAKDSPVMKKLNSFSEEALEKVGNGMITDFLPSWLAFIDKAKYEWLEKVTDWFMDIVGSRIKKHKETFDPDNLRDLVDHILHVEEEAKKEEDGSVMSQLTDDHFNMIIMDLFSAGTDTTRESMYSLLLYVGSSPDVQKKIVEELDSVVGRDRLPVAGDCHKLRYIEAVVFETLRCATVAPLGFPHRTMCDTTVAGFDVPKGSMVLINHMNLHFDPKHWDNPKEFNPSRFIDTDGSIKKSRAWLPFSGGKRVCPGEALAKRQLTYITALIFHHFNVTTVEPPKDFINHATGTALGRLTDPYKVVVSERK